MENEMSIIESSVRMYIRELKLKNPNAEVDEKMSIGRFLDEMKDEPDLLVGFTIYLAEEFLAQSAGKGPQVDLVESIGRDQSILQHGGDDPATALLRENIVKMKAKFGQASKGSFDMEVF